jgi:hypothetical protein
VKAGAHFVAEGVVDETVAFEERFAFERIADDDHLEMSLGTGGNAVLRALVDDLECERDEPLA